MSEEVIKEYGAILVDTSIFDGNGLRLEKGYDLCAILVTDIQRHDSVLLAMGDEGLLEKLPFDRKGAHEFSAPKVVSRKKQLFPAVCEAIRLREH